jgi:hypothetical protein
LLLQRGLQLLLLVLSGCCCEGFCCSDCCRGGCCHGLSLILNEGVNELDISIDRVIFLDGLDV